MRCSVVARFGTCLLVLDSAFAGTSACDKAQADVNRRAGKCPMAKCMADSTYPPKCSRVKRYEMRQALFRSDDPSAARSSNDPVVPLICCEKLCHMETAGGQKCAPLRAATDYTSCVANGNPIMESFPEKCYDPLSGKTFTNIIPASPKPSGNENSGPRQDCGPSHTCGAHARCQGACPLPGPCASSRCACKAGYVGDGYTCLPQSGAGDDQSALSAASRDKFKLVACSVMWLLLEDR